MTTPTTTGPHGIWLPLVTPFRDGEVDETSLKRLVRHYTAQPIDGLILAATTGEGLTLDDEEVARLVSIVAAELEGRLPVYLGVSGSDTRKLAKVLDRTTAWPVDGYLIACPYYTRPSQEGLFRHFATLARDTDKPIMIYNIPYRTGVNMSTETMLRLAELPNIIGTKDCCADAAQSFDILRGRPPGFAVLTGEDALFYGALTQGANGGILAAAHVETRLFARVYNAVNGGNHSAALAVWQDLVDLPRLLFAEPSPAPIKHWLWRAGLLYSPEVRLPMTEISAGLAARIDSEIARRSSLAA
ncbi:MAG TPA: 4-hydroxy-tetrahydrodipicolinate synthase [Vineibacter sp.]|nr:4-hydroxy-tetrahydrodipicolinate synthase [Vineibacter sp.]